MEKQRDKAARRAQRKIARLESPGGTETDALDLDTVDSEDARIEAGALEPSAEAPEQPKE